MLLDVARPVLPGERRGASLEAVSSFLMVEQAKFARLKAKPFGLSPLRFASLQSVLTRKFLPALNSSWLETASLTVSAGREVSFMRTYKVLVFLPTFYPIEAENEEDVLKKVAEFYIRIYKRDFLELVEPLVQPEDIT